MKKKILIWISKHHVFEILITLCFLIYIIVRVQKDFITHYSENEAWFGIAENIICGAFFAVLCFLFFYVNKKIQQKCEDWIKLRTDYDVLANEYCKEKNLIKYSGDKCYPVILISKCLDSGGFEDICINDDKNNFYELPYIIQENMTKIMEAHSNSVVYNADNIRVSDIKMVNNRLFLNTGRTTYFNSLVTNRSMDFEWANSITNRKLFEYRKTISQLKDSKLSNHLGFNGIVESSDGYIFLVKRRGNNSIGKYTYGNSIGASLKTKYCLDSDENFTKEGLYNAIYKEIEDETNIKCSDIESVKIISAYRDLVEGGKPQLLVVINTNKCAKDIQKNFTDSIHKMGKRQKIKTDGDKILWIKINDILSNGIDYYEKSIRVKCYRFSSRYIMKEKMQNLQMVPSTSASILMYKDFKQGVK